MHTVLLYFSTTLGKTEARKKPELRLATECSTSRQTPCLKHKSRERQGRPSRSAREEAFDNVIYGFKCHYIHEYLSGLFKHGLCKRKLHTVYSYSFSPNSSSSSLAACLSPTDSSLSFFFSNAISSLRFFNS